MSNNNHSSLINQTKQFSYVVRSFTARQPNLKLVYEPYILIRHQIDRANSNEDFVCLVNKKTELVIDGFQGSANSFFTNVFSISQTRHVKLSHHMHSPAQIIKAIELEIPVLLLIREPIDAILSLTSRWSYISINCALKNYIDFYNRLEPYSSYYVVSSFSEITHNIEQIVPKINIKFKTEFETIDISQASREKPTPKRIKKLEKRKKIKQEKIKEFSLPININLTKEAQELYKKFERIA